MNKWSAFEAKSLSLCLPAPLESLEPPLEPGGGGERENRGGAGGVVVGGSTCITCVDIYLNTLLSLPPLTM